MNEPTRVRDRQSGRIVEERVFGGNALHFLYGTRRGRLLTELVLKRGAFNALYGWWKRRPSSRAEIAAFVSSLGIDASEAEHPLEHYRSLDDFFTRRLKPGSRPFDPDPTRLCTPAEGRIFVVPLDGRRLAIKGSRVTLDELIGDASLAARYAGGTAVVVRLAPADYHRFHFPDGGVAGPARAIRGPLHSVHPIALGAGAPSLRNRRTITELRTDGFGTTHLVEVGALTVGTIVQGYRPGRVERGQEKGWFRLGGSTVVMLFAPGQIVMDDDLVASSAEGLETFVRVGTSIGRSRRRGTGDAD